MSNYGLIPNVTVSGTVAVTQSTSPWVVDTELPSAVLLSDALTNPTTPLVGGANLLWDSDTSQWQRIRGYASIEGGASLTGLAVTGVVASDGSVLQSLFMASASAVGNASSGIGHLAMHPSWYNGSTYDKALGDSTNGLLVNLGSNNDVTVTASNLDIRDLVFASDKVDVSGSSSVGVTGTFWQATQPISVASLPLPSGASTLAEQQTQTASLSVLDDWDESDRAKVNLIAGQVGVQGASGTVTALTQRVVLATDVALPAGTNLLGKVTAQDDVAATAATTTVASSATNVTLLASNSARKMATIFNDSTQILYIKFGATASATSYITQIKANGYYELPHPIYYGIIDGLWASSNGNARITEY